MSRYVLRIQRNGIRWRQYFDRKSEAVRFAKAFGADKSQIKAQ